MKNKEMLLYCSIYPILTMSFFMFWFSQTTLPGGDIGMAPILLGMVLLIVFVIEMALVLIFGKRLISLWHKLASLIFAFFIYELVMWIFGGSGEIILLESFKRPFEENIEGALSFSSIFSLLVILGLILVNEK